MKSPSFENLVIHKKKIQTQHSHSNLNTLIIWKNVIRKKIGNWSLKPSFLNFMQFGHYISLMNLIHLVIGFQNKSLILTNKLLFHNHTIKIPLLKPPKKVTTNLPKMVSNSNKFLEWYTIQLGFKFMWIPKHIIINIILKFYEF